MPRFAANLHWLFTERPFLERFAAARAAGFDEHMAKPPSAEKIQRILAAFRSPATAS